MQNIDPSNWKEITENITQASQKIIQNLIENQAQNTIDLKDISHVYALLGEKIANEPKELKKVQALLQKFVNNQHELIKQIAERQFNPEKKFNPIIVPAPGDKRFKAAEWEQAPYYFDFIKQHYLLVSQLMNDVVETVETDYYTKRKLNFYTKQYINVFSPSNFAITNPEVLKLAQETNGQSLIDGYKNFLTDIQKGKISQTDETVFEVGKDLACTPGFVIYENELMQLIQYTPTTKKVNEIPLLIIPANINKYYLMDMQPANSLVKYVISEGMTTFMVSWKNGTVEFKDITFDDYIEKGVFKAIEIVQEITKSHKVNTLGNCIGGTILGTAVSILSARTSKKDNPINSVSFLASMIDFSDIGPISDLVSQDLVIKLEKGDLKEKGFLKGDVMEAGFNVVRSNDLIWNCVINNYLKGKDAPPFDLLYWTNDNTNIPAKMFLYYLRSMILENKLSRKNALRICNTQVDIGKIEAPVFSIGFTEDHIAPPQSVFTTTELVSGNVEYILGGAGHVMGVTNAPEKNKYGYRVNGELNNGFEHWKQTAKAFEGSWWTYWTKSIIQLSGKQIEAPKKAGTTKYKVIEAAPGRYLKEKSKDLNALVEKSK
jgi:polyhydroxyalkanoate synthase